MPQILLILQLLSETMKKAILKRMAFNTIVILI